MSPQVLSSLNNLFYFVMALVAILIYYQWKWAKTCKHNVLVLIIKADGHGDYQLAPQDGGSVTLKDPRAGSNTVRMWPINELCTIDVPYPGSGLCPAFLCKQIRMVVVDEKDWEPLLNRSPGREMIASPAVLGNLMHERITEAVMTVNKEMMDSISGIVRRLGSLLSPTAFYIGIGIIILVLVVIAFKVVPAMGQIESLKNNLELLMRAQGIVIPAPTP